MPAPVARADMDGRIGAQTANPLERETQLRRGKQILRDEIAALTAMESALDERFADAVERLIACRGSIVVTGIGKAGIVGQKFAASLSSTGSPSHFLHASEAVHGDLGCVRDGDVVVLLSYSGETEEIIRLVPALRQRADCLIAITSDPANTLGQSVDVVVPIGRHREACSLGLAPTSSTTMMIALCDALALVTSERRGFSKQQFADFHPAGSLGRKLTRVSQVMRPLEECRVASDSLSVREVFVRISRPGRRTGAIMLVDSQGQLTGVFTDSDLARLLESQQDRQLDQPISEVMAREFHTIGCQERLPAAMRIISDFKISELPVVDEHRAPLGIVDITDLVTMGAVPQMPNSKQDGPTETSSERVEAPRTSRSGVPDSPRILSLKQFRKDSI